MLRVFETAIAGGNVLSQDGDMIQPDEDNYDGKAGEAVVKKLFLAPAQTTLAYDIDDAQVQIEVSHAVFDDENYPYIIVVSGEDSEIMPITDGFETKILTVTRADSPISASADDSVFNAYTYHDINLQASDEEGTDESGYVTYAPDVAGSPGSYVSSLTPDDFTDPTSDSYTFWRKVTVPAGSAERKTDLRHEIPNFESFEYAA